MISKYKDEKITQVYPEFNGTERQTAWDAGLLLGMTNVRGIVYHHPGIGQATSGHSVLVTKQAHEIMRWMYTLKQQFSNYHRLICNFIQIPEQVAQFKFKFGQKTFEIIEVSTNRTILTYPEVVREEILNPLTG